MRFSPEGYFPATGSDDGTARVWELTELKPPGNAPVASTPSSVEIPHSLVSPTEHENYPFILTTTLSLAEPSGSGILEGGETGSIEVAVSNAGRGAARTLHVKRTNLEGARGWTFETTRKLSEVTPNGSAKVSIPVRADEATPEQMARIRVEVLEETWGADAEPVLVAFSTRPLKPPRFEVPLTAVGVDDDRIS